MGHRTQPPDQQRQHAAALTEQSHVIAEMTHPETVTALYAMAARAVQPYREVWDGSVPPGGYVCSICGMPVESEPCPQHAPREVTV